MNAPKSVEPLPGVVLSARQWLLWVFGACLLVTPLPLIHPMLGLGEGSTMLLMVVALVAGGSAWLWPLRRRGLVQVAADGLWLDGKKLMAAASIRQAYRSSEGARATVHIQRKHVFGCRVELGSHDE